MDSPSLADHKKHVKSAVKTIQKKMERPDFQERVANEGHVVALEFLDQVRWGLNVMAQQLGRSNPEYVELSEAVAMIGSGCLRWATGRTRVLLSSSDFRRNRSLFDSEKQKVEKCYELINVFSNMVINDPDIRTVVMEVKGIIYELRKKLKRRGFLF